MEKPIFRKSCTGRIYINTFLVNAHLYTPLKTLKTKGIKWEDWAKMG